MKQQTGVKAIIEHNGKYLFLKKSGKYNDIKGYWDISGGRINFSEEPIQGLKREVKEETGLELDKIKQILDASTIYKDKKKQIIRINYLSTVKNTDFKLSKEHI